MSSSRHLDSSTNLISDAETQKLVVEHVAEAAKTILNAQRVLLFGSRAKGTHHCHSDYDFAIEAAPNHRENWAIFWNEIDEHAKTLNKIDLVNLSSPLNPRFLQEILDTGIDITKRGSGDESKG